MSSFGKEQIRVQSFQQLKSLTYSDVVAVDEENSSVEISLGGGKSLVIKNPFAAELFLLEQNSAYQHTKRILEEWVEKKNDDCTSSDFTYEFCLPPKGHEARFPDTPLHTFKINKLFKDGVLRYQGYIYVTDDTLIYQYTHGEENWDPITALHIPLTRVSVGTLNNILETILLDIEA